MGPLMKHKKNVPTKRRGFILVIILGMLAVLAVLGLSFAEQGRVDLLGARNTADASAADELSEAGFQMGLRLLADDRNTPSADNGTWESKLGTGWSSRWGYNANVTGTVATGGTQAALPAPVQNDPKMRSESWQSILHNEELKGSNRAYAYNFRFDPNDIQTTIAQRHPSDSSVQLDIWQRQPLVGVKRWRVRQGNSYAIIQVGISPRDGGINLNDVFDAGTVTELPGEYEQLEGSSASSAVPYASPDRRTLEYILGKPPEFINRGPEVSDAENRVSERQPLANMYHGNLRKADGVYNFRRYFEPQGLDAGPGALKSHYMHGFLTRLPPGIPTVYYDPSPNHKAYYNFEGARYPVWSATAGASLKKDASGNNELCYLTRGKEAWFPSGRLGGNGCIEAASPFPRASYPARGQLDCLFRGFGFDMFDSRRGGIGGAGAVPFCFKSFTATARPFTNEQKYIGAGLYGYPKQQSFQRHFFAAAFKGRFMTDLQANWHFGGAPGYCTVIGTSTTDPVNWTPLGSSYDSMGMGSNWMPPLAHVWSSGFKKWGGVLSQADLDRGMTRYHGNMPPAKPAVTYAYPLKRWDDDPPIANAHWLFNDPRITLRSSGIQENWGLYGQDDEKGRKYDGININTANFQVVYGLLTPEKIPSMAQRTIVAPHLHWKARMLDGAYKNMETFARYNPTPEALRPYLPDRATAATQIPSLVTPPPVAPAAGGVDYRYGHYQNDPGNLAAPNLDPKLMALYDPVANPVIPFGANPEYLADPNLDFPPNSPGLVPPNRPMRAESRIDPIWYKYSLHKAYLNRGNGTPLSNPAAVADADRIILGKMDYVTPEPATYELGIAPGQGDSRQGSGVAADDVFIACNYDLTLYDPNSLDPRENVNDLQASRQVCRPVAQYNWADWFLQRNTDIPAVRNTGIGQRPDNNKPPYFKPIESPEGKVPGYDVATRRRADPVAKPHPIHGLPNPDYLMLYPQAAVTSHWADQFRRYFPYGGDDTGGGAPDPTNKLVDRWEDPPAWTTPPQPGPPTELSYINPAAPVPKIKRSEGNPTDPYVPGIGKDEAWRLTRVGRSYQEILADELMDYQMNPWWPSPCKHFTDVGVPLDREARVSPSREAQDLRNPATNNLNKWWSYIEFNGLAGMRHQLPDYFTTYNRFWTRAAGLYPDAEPYRATDNDVAVPPRPKNPIENQRIYPQDFQYFGQFMGTGNVPGDPYKDHVKDFPANALEYQLGAEWRYLSGTLRIMLEDGGAALDNKKMARIAPARNHPFRNVADVVAFLGHLVYRSPIAGDLSTNPNHAALAAAGLRGPILGVCAAVVCHTGTTSHARNKPTFFDGSRIGGDTGAEASALMGYYGYDSNTNTVVAGAGGRNADQAVVAVDGYWPVSGNYGAWPGPYPAGMPNAPEDLLYPARVAPWATDAEWRRRVDEWRGRDAAGLRVEQHYISEAAANDVLVSFFNARVAPIDFDGDGRVTMTSKRHLPDPDSTTTVNENWLAYPYHNLSGGGSGVQVARTPGTDYNQNAANLNYGVPAADPADRWRPADKNEILQGCVTLPIKFRSNTFRISVVVELTDPLYRNVYAVRRYAKVVSRIPGPAAEGTKVYGPYTGEFIQHTNQAMSGVDPYTSWLGTK